MSPPQESIEKLRFLSRNELSQSLPHALLSSNGPGHKQVIDIHSQQLLLLSKEKGAGMSWNGLATNLSDGIGKVPLPVSTALWVSVQCLTQQTIWTIGSLTLKTLLLP